MPVSLSDKVRCPELIICCGLNPERFHSSRSPRTLRRGALRLLVITPKAMTTYTTPIPVGTGSTTRVDISSLPVG